LHKKYPNRKDKPIPETSNLNRIDKIVPEFSTSNLNRIDKIVPEFSTSNLNRIDISTKKSEQKNPNCKDKPTLLYFLLFIFDLPFEYLQTVFSTTKKYNSDRQNKTNAI